MAGSKTRGRRTGILLITGLTFVTGAVWGGYVGYDYTESTTFCASRCHTAMAPQAAAHERSAHAGVACVQCHVANGVGPHLRSKFASSSRVLTAAFNSYRGPIRSPHEHSRLVSDRCESCHQLQNAIPTKPLRLQYFRLDESNTPEQLALTLYLATADGPRGAHWHANAKNRVTYAASDTLRQSIPWIHVRRADGSETTYASAQASVTPGLANQVIEHEMGCVDCHNRTGHQGTSPEPALDRALLDGRIAASLPWIKAFAVRALTSRQPQGAPADAIMKSLLDDYQTHAPAVLLEKSDAVHAAGKVVAEIHSGLVFPALRADHTSYPNNLGHRRWPGCFRCHDGQHVAADGKALANDCSETCHSEPQRSPQGEPVVNGTANGENWHPWPSPAKVLDIPGHRQLICSNCHRSGGSPKRTCDDCHAPG